MRRALEYKDGFIVREGEISPNFLSTLTSSNSLFQSEPWISSSRKILLTSYRYRYIVIILIIFPQKISDRLQVGDCIDTLRPVCYPDLLVTFSARRRTFEAQNISELVFILRTMVTAYHQRKQNLQLTLIFISHTHSYNRLLVYYKFHWK